jgi:hypothetical protein
MRTSYVVYSVLILLDSCDFPNSCSGEAETTGVNPPLQILPIVLASVHLLLQDERVVEHSHADLGGQFMRK